MRSSGTGPIMCCSQWYSRYKYTGLLCEAAHSASIKSESKQLKWGESGKVFIISQADIFQNVNKNNNIHILTKGTLSGSDKHLKAEKIKVKLSCLCQTHKGIWQKKGYSSISIGVWLTSGLRRFTTGKDSQQAYPLNRTLGGLSSRSWQTGEEKKPLKLAGIWTLNR